MLRRVLLGLAFGLTASCAGAQTAPSPADVGVSKGTPDVFKLKGHDNAWTPFGSVDPSTHIFIPGTNGSIAPNDCVKWGPGLTSAGAACNSVTGGATPANQLTIYTSHAGLTANVTTPTEAWTVLQQGFYAPGDGGGATYQWSFASYCAGGTSSTPVAADGIACVLPSGQSASTAGRYLLQTSGELDVRMVGMQPGGADNYPLVQTLMNAISPTPAYNNGNMQVVFPGILGQLQTYYYFSRPFSVSRGAKITCKSGLGSNQPTVSLVFAPGVDGVIQEAGQISPDGGYGQSEIHDCEILSLGSGAALVHTGSNALTNVQLDASVIPGLMTPPAGCGSYGGVQCALGVGDAIIQMQNSLVASSPAPGAYIGTSNPAARTATLASPYVMSPAYVDDGRPNHFISMPASQAYTVNTTLGSSSITVTAGPSFLKPGDMVWSSDFLLGSSVQAISGNTLPQTATLTGVTLTAAANATASHTGGKLWVIPAGLKRRVEASSYSTHVKGFGVGLDMICSSGASPPIGCTSSFDEHNAYTNGLIGRLVRGNNSAASSVIGNVYGQNMISDTVEAASLGSNYIGDEYNSQEEGYSLYGVLVVCGSQNYSNFIGSYISGQYAGPCMGVDAQGNASIGVPASGTGGMSELFIGTIYGLSNISQGSFSADYWSFSGPYQYTETATIATASGTVIAVPTTQLVFPGMKVIDLTNPVIPTNTTITKVLPNSLTISNALTGGGIQIGDQIYLNSNGPCVTINAGLASGANGMYFDTGCTHFGLGISYDKYRNSWNLNNVVFPNGDGYAGYNTGAPVFTAGLQLGNGRDDYIGQERQLDSGDSPPGSGDGRLQGDIRLNQHTAPGSPLAWTNTPSFTTTLSGNVTGGTTTTVAVAACPSPALPAGTSIIDASGTGFVAGIIARSNPLGTLSSCTSTTMTLQAAALNSGTSGDTIQFLQWRQAGRVANDVAGTSVLPASMSLIANLAPCNGDLTVGLGIAYDGQTTAAAGYGAPVGSTTGPIRRLVFCDGVSWTYH